MNLPHRTDRWRLQQVQAPVHRLVLHRVVATSAEQARQVHPHSPLSGGELGLLESISRLLLELSAQHGWVLVVEDDAVFKPQFVRRIITLVSAVPDSAWLIQAGYLSESSIRPSRTVLQNVRKVLRPRSRYRRWRSTPPVPRSGLFTHVRAAGAHVLVVNAAHAEEMRMAISHRLPWDKEIQRWTTDSPGRVFTARTSVAWQLPTRSDIRGSRRPRRSHRVSTA